MNPTLLQNQLKQFLKRKNTFIPQLSIDCVIFGFHGRQLKVLLLKNYGMERLVLPSGFIDQTEDIDTAALRNLRERTGLHDIFLRQFHTFGRSSRFFPDQLQQFIEGLGIERAEVDWLFKRFVTVGYYALVNFSEVNLSPGLFTEQYVWADVNVLPLMAMDHTEIIEEGLAFLRRDLQTQPVGLNLLPEPFTLPELQSLYETILGRPIDRGNFRKKMLNAHILESLGKTKSIGAHRSPNLYRFNRASYEELLQEGVKIGF